VADVVDKRPVFARRLAQARGQSGLSQKQLGLRAGMEPSVASPRVNQYEQGIHEPKLAMAKKLADALGIPPAFLYCEDELLAKLLLRWGDLTVTQKKELLKLAGVPTKAKPTPER
jgi:transcriptional regulator with XRE-family HTH domain